jgi:hypothetical protein
MRVPPRLLRLVVVSTLVVAVLAGAAGCAECSSDIDCPERHCVDGACSATPPDDAPGSDCDDDAGCAGGERCFAGVCVVTPTCQQLNANFIALRAGTGERGEILATSDGCDTIRLAVALGTGATALDDMSAAGIDDDGTWLGPTGFAGGAWDSARRAGTLELSSGDVVRFGTAEYVCVVDDDCTGQLATTCRTACDAGCNGPCANGLCAPANRGVCQ